MAMLVADTAIDYCNQKVIGEDVAGVVVKTGSLVTRVKKGDRVLGYSIALGTNEPAHAGFQSHSVMPELTVAPIPASLSFEQAAVVPLGLSTAAAALYGKDFLKLPYPKLSSAAADSTVKKSILVWGGSSSVGGNTIQLAVASGIQVYTTCSRRNFDYVKALGASQVFDYSDETSVVNQLVDAMFGTKLLGAVDTIGDEKTLKASASVIDKLGGGMVVGVLPGGEKVDVGKNVTIKTCKPLSTHNSLNAPFQAGV
jgi:NADPH:quinone reductase-like Zn-dependent oxidoreductase